MEKKLPGTIRIMYLIPILLCVTFALVMVIQYTAIPQNRPKLMGTTDRLEIHESGRRGQELVDEYQQQESLLKTMNTMTG